ncbi:putative oxidoreductase YghA [Paraburkholderia hiiakae]|uniref:Oxidoreductase YghA n=1 Tax=Paraburkholderia hiiakae TaxID=1081782 RepID=A0ABM8P4Y2_9BURK|nr:putative oxidoreductase YghA [Paraburkholderia hiiakae]
MSPTVNQYAMQDPTNQYPGPEFARQPAELAPIYVVPASQESSFVTGEIYGATGGNHLP